MLNSYCVMFKSFVSPASFAVPTLVRSKKDSVNRTLKYGNSESILSSPVPRVETHVIHGTSFLSNFHSSAFSRLANSSGLMFRICSLIASTSWLSGSGVGLWFVSAPFEGTRIEDDGESMPVGFSEDMVARVLQVSMAKILVKEYLQGFDEAVASMVPIYALCFGLNSSTPLTRKT